MAHGLYVARLDAVAVSTARTLVQVNAPATAALEIVRMWVSQSASTTSQQTEVQALTTSTAGTGTAFTPVPMRGAAAAASTASNNHTAEGTAATSLLREGFNVLNGWYWQQQEETEEIWVAPSGRIAIKFPSAPSAITVSAGIVFWERGGA